MSPPYLEQVGVKFHPKGIGSNHVTTGGKK